MIKYTYKQKRLAYSLWKSGVSLDSPQLRGFNENMLLGLNSDYCLTINDVADILGFSLEHTQSHVIPVVGAKDTDDYIKEYMCNKRLKKVVSKSSIQSYVTESLSITDRRNVVEIEKDSQFILKLKELLGPGGKIQKLLDDMGKWLDKKFNANELEKSIKGRKEYLKELAEENDINLIHFLQTGSLDAIEILDYYEKEKKLDKESYNENTMFDIIVDDMYSIKTLKERMGFKYTNQVYRHLDKISYIAVKLNDDEYVGLDSTDRVKGDRNIRYIISREDLNIKKGVYRLSLNHWVYEKITKPARMLPGMISEEDVILDILAEVVNELINTEDVNVVNAEDAIINEMKEYIRLNKEKYIKKKKENED